MEEHVALACIMSTEYASFCAYHLRPVLSKFHPKPRTPYLSYMRIRRDPPRKEKKKTALF